MRIADTKDRERLWEMLVECSDQQTKSKAIEDAARYYCRMRGARFCSSVIYIWTDSVRCVIDVPCLGS